MEAKKKTPGALKNMMQESQNGCKRNNLRADEETQLTVARTNQQEEEEDSGISSVGSKDNGIKREVSNITEQRK